MQHNTNRAFCGIHFRNRSDGPTCTSLISKACSKAPESRRSTSTEKVFSILLPSLAQGFLNFVAHVLQRQSASLDVSRDSDFLAFPHFHAPVSLV